MNVRNVVTTIAGLAGVFMLGNSAVVAQQMASGDGQPSVQATVPPLFAVLLGGNEVSETGNANAGHPDGYGSATVIIRGTTLCFGITVDGIDKPTLAHIHQAPAGVNGDIVVPLIPPPNGNPGTSSRCIFGLDQTLLTDIQRHATGFYVNVHTENFPAGAVRGQLF
ncbi:MAG: CHRD domain-containing protein [Hyphomicrobiales bacterium]